MGFLDHSTNNILIDAVLTDFGRQLLAENQGAFKIAFFSLGDDEVDYSIIRKFGRTVGKEKISKNTPIYEAQTLASTAMKHRLITLSDPVISQLPRMTIEASDSVEGSVVTMNEVTSNLEIVLKQQTVGSSEVPTGMSDTTFTVRLNDRFLQLTGTKQNLIGVEPYSKVASYQVTAEPAGTGNIASVKLLLAKRSPGAAAYTQFGDFDTNGTQVTTVLSVIGDQSGLRKDLKVIVHKP
mgnify:CR=1 FL=1